MILVLSDSCFANSFCVYLKELTLRFLKQMEGNVFLFRGKKTVLVLGKLKFSFYLLFLSQS